MNYLIDCSKAVNFFKTVMTTLNPEDTSWEELCISKYKSPDEVKFLKAGNIYKKSRLPTTAEADGEERDNSSKFDESWPVSERPSTIRSVPISISLESTCFFKLPVAY